ncbi:otu domain-containing protein at3g57810 [Phtheirospermum japonicum]|uniref:Ubiquitin thioesterase OTU n=1 Tax=Phtheirospermum japonicum TaxID=374723 RepID=A0A830CWY0_9LAMI|nr:otu domain-containing protein at3g57810 [Phtheirospermum japonicum]
MGSWGRLLASYLLSLSPPPPLLSTASSGPNTAATRCRGSLRPPFSAQARRRRLRLAHDPSFLLEPAADGGSEPPRARRGEAAGRGSWNVAWDARPARWLHYPDSAWLLFGVCSTLAAVAAPPLIDSDPDSNLEPADRSGTDPSCNYRVTGVTADGRCLFRAIAHMACLRNGEEAPDENRQRELADELRAQVVEELLKRRKEVEWFMEEEFDVYVKRIQQPYAWGGEPELLMCSHVLRRPISVYMKERSSSSLIKIANYGEEYRRDDENSIDVLFHGYGHYDILESLSGSRREVNC